MRTRAFFPILIAVPTALVAQRSGGGTFGRGRTPGQLARQPGVEVPSIINGVNLLIQHRPDLALSDTQFVRIVAIKRALDSTNAPLMRRIDSVARLFKSTPIFSRVSPERRDSLATGRAVVNETLADVNANIAEAREKAYGFLSASQMTKAEQIEDEARKAGASPSRGRL